MSDPLARQREVLRRIAARLKAQRRSCRVPTLILLTSDDHNTDWTMAVRALPRGSAVVVRARDRSRRERLAQEIMRVAKPRGVLMLVAADPKLAIRLRANGVHVPEASVASALGLKTFMPHWIVTSSAHGVRGLILAGRLRADAALLSPMFRTQSHPSTRPLGVVNWAKIRAVSNVPVIALGGIDAATASQAVLAGAGGIALIGGWIKAS